MYMCKHIYSTSVLFGKNQHKTPTKPPNTTPINSSIGPLKMLNTMFPRIFKYQVNISSHISLKQLVVTSTMLTVYGGGWPSG